MRSDGDWVWRIEWAKPSTPDSGLNVFQAWLWAPWQLSLACLLAGIVLLAAVVEYVLRKSLNALLG